VDATPRRPGNKIRETFSFLLTLLMMPIWTRVGASLKAGPAFAPAFPRPGPALPFAFSIFASSWPRLKPVLERQDGHGAVRVAA
jgi:hypothetical protein